MIFFSPVRALLVGKQMAGVPCAQSASPRSTKPPSAFLGNPLLLTLCHFCHPPIFSSPPHVSPRARGWVQRSWSRTWSSSSTRTLSQPEESYRLVTCSSVWLHKEIRLNTFPEEINKRDLFLSGFCLEKNIAFIWYLPLLLLKEVTITLSVSNGLSLEIRWIFWQFWEVISNCANCFLFLKLCRHHFVVRDDLHRAHLWPWCELERQLFGLNSESMTNLETSLSGSRKKPRLAVLREASLHLQGEESGGAGVVQRVNFKCWPGKRRK